MTVAAEEIPAARECQRHPLTVRLAAVALGYQQVLNHNPNNAGALIGMSLVALASRQSSEAVLMAQAAVVADPEMIAAWVTLGQALKCAGRTSEAEQAYAEALQRDGMDAAARTALAELKLATDRPGDAITDYELALHRQPSLISAHLGLGHALMCSERYTEALDSYERALAFEPHLAEAEIAAGFALSRMGQAQEAEIRYRRALVERPDFAAAWLNLGCLLREQGREIYAEAALKRALELQPDMIAGWVNLALLERERHHSLAEEYLRTAFALNPGQVETHVAWAQFCEAEHDYAGAWGWVRWALARNPKNDEAQNMHGILLHLEGRFDEAVAAFERAESLGSRPAASNRGNSLLDLGRTQEALQAHVAAVMRDPASAGARYNLALTQLRLGDWQRGWPAYEARWNFPEVHREQRQFAGPRWQGEPLFGRRILLHAEQGLGDTIQFCRYATLVSARGGFPILQVREPVQRLVESLPLVRAGQAEIAVPGSEPPAFELECALMSLPAIFGTTVETAPWPGAYLGAEPAAVAAKREQFPSLNRLRIGLAWAGNPRYKADRHRSTQLEILLPLLRVPEVTWISLQKGEAAQQLASLPRDIAVLDGSSHDQDLAETAALLATLDLVVTTDTCIAHLAGAMGKPVWILLPHLSDWRWMQDIETTPWYPTARLFRQPAPGDWNSVLMRARDELSSF